MQRILNFTILLITFLTLQVSAQNDATLISEAQYAIKLTPPDCRAAKKSLDEVSEDGKSSRLFIYYMAKTEDCLNEFDLAITYYNKYLEFAPNDAEIVQRIAELSYKKRKESDRYKIAGNWKRSDNSKIWTISQYDNQDIAFKNSEGILRFFGILVNGQPTSYGKEHGLEFDADLFTDKDGNSCHLCRENNFSTDAYIDIDNDGNSIRFYAKSVSCKPSSYTIDGSTYIKHCCEISYGTAYEYVFTLYRQ